MLVLVPLLALMLCAIDCHWCHVLSMASHNQKERDVTSQFDCFDLRNMMVPLMTPLASCNNMLAPVVSYDVNVVNVAPHFDHHKECNGCIM